MARRESSETLELRWKRVGFVLFAVAGIAGLTIGYSLQRRAHDELGIQIKSIETEIGWAKGEIRDRREKLARQQRREPITRQLMEMHIDLTNIVPSQRRVIPLLARPSIASGATPGVAPAASNATGTVSPAGMSRPAAVGPLTGTVTSNIRPGR